MAHLSKLFFVAEAFLVTTCAVYSARATEPPADVCSLLPAAEVSKTLGQAYDSPQKSVAPRPFANTVTGTDCSYRAVQSTLLFRAYVDPSPSASKELFAKLKMFYSPPTPVPNLGDEAYFDPQHAIHVRKGKVRFYLNLGEDAAAEKPLKDLASQVGGRL